MLPEGKHQQGDEKEGDGIEQFEPKSKLCHGKSDRQNKTKNG